MTRVSENYVSNSHRTECWYCGIWYKNALKDCPRCHTANEDHALSLATRTATPIRPKETRELQKICPQCKKQFTISDKQKRKYCSKTCSDSAQRTGFNQKAYMKAYYLKRKLEKQKRAKPDEPQTRAIAK